MVGLEAKPRPPLWQGLVPEPEFAGPKQTGQVWTCLKLLSSAWKHQLQMCHESITNRCFSIKTKSTLVNVKSSWICSFCCSESVTLLKVSTLVKPRMKEENLEKVKMMEEVELLIIIVQQWFSGRVFVCLVSMVSHQALISFQRLRAQAAVFHTGALHLHSRLLPTLLIWLSINSPPTLSACRLVQRGVAQRTATKPKHNRNPSWSTSDPVTHRCQTFLDTSFILWCAESVPSLRVQLILVPSPTFGHKLPVQLDLSGPARWNTTTAATITDCLPQKQRNNVNKFVSLLLPNF